MNTILDSEEFKQAVILVDGLANCTLADALEDLACRERDLMNTSVSPEVREILVHNFAILVSAATRIRYNMDGPDSTKPKSAHAKQSGE